MKKIYLISAAVLCIIAAASCEKEIAGPENIRTSISATLAPSSKTALGEKDGTSWPNYWKAGDQISVNGVTSDALDSEADGKSSATFTFTGVIDAPLCAAYPAAAVSEYSAGSATLTVPATQNYVAGSYDPAAFLMGGKSTVAGDVFLSPCVSIIHLSLTGSASITKVKLTGPDGSALSGSFTTDFSNYTPATVSNVVEMVAATPVALGSEPADFFICVPAGLSGQVKFEIFDSDGGSMTKNATVSSALTAGKMFAAPTLAYVASFEDITITAEGITSSTAIICWDNAPTVEYSIGVYSDDACTALVDSYTVPAGDSCWGGASPRFCISGLTAGTKYYVKVSNPGKDSNVLEVTTAAFSVVEVSSTPAAVDEIILAEDFSELRWDSEVITRGVGFFPTSTDSFANNDVDSFRAIATSSEKVLSSQGTALAASRLAHWAQGANANLYIHPGYIKLVGNSKVTHLVTPALDNIPDGKLATLEVKVTACPYCSSNGTYATMDAIVAVQPAGTCNELTDDTKTNTLDLSTNVAPITLDEAVAWKEYTVTLTGVSKGARLAFGAAADITANTARMNISDMTVTIKALEEPGITASVKSVSSSSAVFTWTYGGSVDDDSAKPYTIALYSDSACSNLVVSHSIDADHACWNDRTPCFVFGGLNPATEYWFVATDTASSVSSDPVSATTEAFTVVDATTVTNATVGDVILAEDFSEIGAGPDEIARAAGFKPSSSKVLPFIPSGANPAGSYEKDIDGYSPYGDRVIGAGWDLGSSRLSNGWGFFGGSSCYYGAGYLRLSTSSGRTHIVTPALSGIPAGKEATIEVTVTASRYESSGSDVAVFAEKGLTIDGTDNLSSSSYKKYTGASLSDGHALGITSVKSWQTKSVTISKVESDHQLLIGSLENAKNRCYISDVVVSIVSLKDKGTIDAVMDINDFTSFKDFLTACEPGKTIQGNVTADIALTSAQVEEIDALYPVADFDGIINGNNHTISGLAKPLFAKFTGTVSDLTLSSSLSITDAMNNIGILAGSAEDATISGCVTNGSVAFSSASSVNGNIFIAGMVGYFNGGTMTNCTNNAPVTNATASSDTTNGIITVGGLTGYANSVTFSKCINNGDVTNSGVSGSGDTYCRVGGLVGWAVGSDLSASGDNKNINYGDVTEASDSKDSAFAGVVAYAEGAVSNFSNCRNEGDITIGGAKTYIFIGGIAGAFANSSVIDNTYNSGDLSASGASMAKSGYLRCGGILGGWFKAACTSQTITGCTNTGAITLQPGDFGGEAGSTDSYVGGIAGGGKNDDGKCGKELKNCTNSGNITMGSTGSVNSGKLYHRYCVGGITGFTDVNPTGSKCIANIRFRSTTGTNRIGGIAGEMMIEEIHDVTYKGTVNSNGASGTNYTGGLVGNVGTGTKTFTNCTVSGTMRGPNSTTTPAGIFCSNKGSGTGPTINITNCKVGSGTRLQAASSGYYITIQSASDITASNVFGHNGSNRNCTAGTNSDNSVVEPDTITL
ncbi:MAG: hypothetical protein J5640_03740 [Bacteroidales bacterium]|nr:hypothetical protein [Bacteroidales bacterium]